MERRKKRIIIKSVAIVIFLVLLYILLPYIQGFIENPPGTAYIPLPKNMSFEFERDIKIDAFGNYVINITIPTNTSFQSVFVGDESHKSKTIINDYNRTWWSYSLSGSSYLKIIYKGKTELKVWDIKNSLDVDNIPLNLKKEYNHDEYIKDEHGKSWVIQPSEFKSIGESITKGKGNVVDKLRAIYDYMVKNFRYISEKNGAPKTAVQTWNDGEGDCDELSFVFVSIARSIGIPSWVEYGLLYTGDTWGAHAWVGAVVPTKTTLYYVNIDVTAEVGKGDYGRGFLIRDPYTLREWRDDGNSKHLSSYYQLIYGHYTRMDYVENFKIIKIDEGKKEMIPVGNGIPSWLMILIITIIILAIFIAIIRF